MLNKLSAITKTPTAINMYFGGTLEVSLAEKGAVMIPPISSPNTIFQW